MDKKELFKSAKADWMDALNLALIIGEGMIGVNIVEMLENYAIMKKWCSKFEKKIGQAKKLGNAQEEESYTELKKMFSEYITKYEENVLAEFEPEILGYFKLKKQVGYSKEELWVAKIFVSSAEKIESLAVKNWKQFLTE